MFNNLEVIRTTDVHLEKNLILSLQSAVHKLNACVHCLDIGFFSVELSYHIFRNIIDTGYFFSCSICVDTAAIRFFSALKICQ